MRKTALHALVVAATVLVATLTSVSIGNAAKFDSDIEKQYASWVRSLPVRTLPNVAWKNEALQNRLAIAFALRKQALAGNSYALKQLEMMSKSGWASFPKMKISSAAWGLNQLKENPKLKYSELSSAPGLQAAAATGAVPYRNPAPSFSQNMLVTRDLGPPVQTEPSICANPEDPDNVILAVTDYGLWYNSIYASFDGGETWQGPRRNPLMQNTEYAADPVLACGRDGKTYHTFMSIGQQDFQLQYYLPVTFTRSDIAVSVSSDGGMTWDGPSKVTTNEAEVFGAAIGDEVLPVLMTSFLDKPWMAVGPDPKDPSKDVVYVSYTKFTDYTVILNVLGFIIPIPLQWTSEIVFWSSSDNGKTWNPAGATEALAGFGWAANYFQRVNYRWVQGSQVEVAKDGTVYASWYDALQDGGWRGNNAIMVMKSRDKGKTWSKPAVAAKVLETSYKPRTAHFRNTGSALPQMAVWQRSETAERAPGVSGAVNELYLVFAARTEGKPTDDGDVYFVRGLDNGDALDFSEPKRVNEDRADALQFFPTIAVDDKGVLHLMWGDTRDDPAGLKYHIYYTQSEDRGDSWGFVIKEIREPDTRVTDFYSNPNKAFPYGAFIGDYFSIAPRGDSDVYLAWADSRLAEYEGGFNQKIAFARRAAIAAPEIVINPDQGPMGQEIEVQAYDFQPDAYLYVKVGARIQGVGKTDEKGYASFKTDMSISASERSQTIRVFDESGNFADVSYRFEVGINDLARADDVKKLEQNVNSQNSTLTTDIKEIKALQSDNVRLVYLLLGVVLGVVALCAGFLLIRSRLRKKNS